MDIKLLVCLKATRNKFFQEDYLETDHIFALVRSGSFTVASPSEQFTVGPMEGVLFRADRHYYRKVLTPVTMYLFRYRTDDDNFRGDHILFRDLERIRSTLDLLETLEGTPQKADLTLHEHLLKDLMIQQRIEALPTKEHDARIQKALTYIMDRLDQKIILSELAAVVGLSYAQFFRLFKENVGAVPSDHILMLRLQRARQLLVETDLPIREIAAACGFENEFYFSNVFKKQTALAPSVFRRQLR